ncbi:MAG: cyclic nucleotide-binding domain-containing protein [Chloroflexota bacterium]|nr:cyclic nucleotide-binding domain-containing protein [Chloroflexota bacterium]
MKTQGLLQKVELFRGLTEDELTQLANICEEERLQEGETFATEGETGDTFCIIKDGLMKVEVNQTPDSPPHVIVHLGRGQLIGEMSLIDRGVRSATVRAIQTPTEILVIRHNEFHGLCEKNNRIGYVVMRNMAADLSFKLRHRSLSEQGR